MTRGRKPMPTTLKVLLGNPGKKRLNPNEPRPRRGLPAAPPRHLTPAARAVWKRLRKQLVGCGIAAVVDATAFELLCTSYADYLAACEKVAEFGAVWIDRGKGKSNIPKFAYSPYWSVMNREWKKVQTMLAEFGMTPSSRSRVSAVPGASDESLEERYFGGGGGA